MGLLSSGRGFHIFGTFFFRISLSSEKINLCLERLSQISIRSLTASLLLDFKMQIVTVGVRLKGNLVLIHGILLPNFTCLQ